MKTGNWRSLLRSEKKDRTPEVPVMMPQSAEQSTGWTEERIRQLFDKCADVTIKRYELGGPDQRQPLLTVSCDGMTDVKQMNEYVLPRLERMTYESTFDPTQHAELALTRFERTKEIITRVFSGQLVLYFIKLQQWFALDISDPPKRMPMESNTELSIKGPRDGFIEELQTNVALVRKRLRTNSLRYEQFTIGKKSESKVALLYIEGFARQDFVDEARKRLQHLELEVLFSSAQLEEALSDSSYTLFPLLTYSGRPDFVVDCLIRGRFAIIADGAPIAVIAPVNLTLLLKSPEDIYFPFPIVTFELMIRMAGLLIALYLPGFWIALASFNLEQIPFPLLATLVVTRLGLPLPGPLEAFLMLGLFELFREAGVRLPKAVGQTIAVVGGIVVGDAVIRAGLASTTMLIVAAITAVATFTLVNQTLSSAVSIIRLLVMICAATLGMYGFILALIAIVLHLSKLQSFGVPYLTPMSPTRPKDLFAALFQRPLRHEANRPQFLQSEDANSRGGDS